MKIPAFRLERYFAQYEFQTEYLLGSSDCESIPVGTLLDMQPGAEDEFRRLWLGYTESAGNPGLREEIAGQYSQVEANDILVHTGAEEAIFIFLNAVLEKGDHVIVHWPCYQSLYEIAKPIGCEITLWTGRPDNGWRLDVEYLAKNLRSNTRAVLINCPHNPTGYLMEREDWLELNRLSERHGFILFSDEVYRGLEYQETNRLPACCEINERSVSLNVLSKSFGLAGLRLGWIATRNREVYEQMAALKDYTTICNSAPSEFLGTLALRNRGEIVGRNQAIIARNLVVLDGFFTRHADRFSWERPKAGPIAFPSLADEIDAEDFCRKLVENAGVMLLPGVLYDPAYRNHFRIGFGRENMPAAIARLEEFIAGM